MTGNMNYEPENHQHMVNTRAKKVENVAELIDPVKVAGPEVGRFARAQLGRHLRRVQNGRGSIASSKGMSVGHAHLRWVNPFPKNLGEVLEQVTRRCWCPN